LKKSKNLKKDKKIQERTHFEEKTGIKTLQKEISFFLMKGEENDIC